MPLKPPSFKVILELLSFLTQIIISLVLLCLSLPIIIVKIIIQETLDNVKMYLRILSKSNFIKRLKT
jgi:hypothetical protein